MANLTADMFISLDGFAGADDSAPYFGYDGPELSEWVRTALDEYPTIVMGRGTYEALAPFATSAADPVSVRMSELEKLVFSNTLREPAAWANTRFVRGELKHEMTALKESRPSPMRTIGSLSLVRSLIELRLIDRLRVITFPVIVGPDGSDSFLLGYPRIRLELIGTRVLDSRLVLTEYALA
jgi:dihydrofolate reductase